MAHHPKRLSHYCISYFALIHLGQDRGSFFDILHVLLLSILAAIIVEWSGGNNPTMSTIMALIINSVLV